MGTCSVGTMRPISRYIIAWPGVEIIDLRATTVSMIMTTVKGGECAETLARRAKYFALFHMSLPFDFKIPPRSTVPLIFSSSII